MTKQSTSGHVGSALAADDAAAPSGWMARLNEPQRNAVTSDAPSVMIVAGAGTGKTGTLAARVAYLLDSGVRPDRILLLTFTRRAAQEMLSRADRMAADGDASRVWGGTFHAVGNRLLRQWGSVIGLDPSFTVMDQGDARELFGVVRTDAAAATSRRFPKKETLASIYDRLVSTQRKLKDVLTTDFPWCLEHAEAIGAIFGQYTERKRRRNVLDYDDLLLFWRALLSAPTIGAEVRSRFDHVLVDEFQDTNPIQADIVHAFGDGGATITVVGDDAQAIYGFRNATVENMWAFPERRVGTEQITLDQNYRSIMPILELANDVLLGEDAGPENPHFDKRLWSNRVGQRQPRLVICGDEQAQSVAVADRVLELREEGMSLSDQAVLFRASHHSELLEVELAARNIPFVKYGGLKFLEAAHVKDLLALLRLLDNPRDELAWHRVLKLLPGVGPGTVRRVLAEIGLDDESDPDRALNEFLAGRATLPTAARQPADVLRSAMSECRGDAELQPPPAVQVDRLAAALAPLIEDRYDRAAVRLGDLEQLGVIASAYSQRSQLLTELVLDPPSSTGDLADEPHLDDDYLILSTIHSAKGGEWNAVHLIHAADGNLPSDMALNEKGGLDEERRLAYVALTRARDVLDVYVPMRYHHRRYGMDDAHNVAPLSRFFSPYRDRFEQVGSVPVGGVESPAVGEARFGVADEVDSLLHGLWSE